MIPFLLLWLILVMLEAEMHYNLIEKQKTRPNYLQWFSFRGFTFIVFGAILQPSDILEYLPIFLFQLSTHWLIFDKRLNEKRNKPFWYTGKNSGWLDRFLGKHPVLHKVLYGLVGVVAGVSIYLILS